MPTKTLQPDDPRAKRYEDLRKQNAGELVVISHESRQAALITNPEDQDSDDPTKD